MDQIIIHVDMDAFYASVEVRDDPSLKGKPLIIGSLPSERGVVATCSYEARKFGVHSAMNIKEAYRLCPEGVYMHPNFKKYREASDRLHEIWNEYASASEYLSLDEAYLDVTRKAVTFEGAREIAMTIKRRTKEELGLSCSVGVAYSKTAAKTASEEKKPDGYFEIRTPEDFRELVVDRDVGVLYTVGKKTAEKLNRYGINTVRDIRNNRDLVIKLLGKHGEWISDIALGIDDRKVTPYKPEDTKSISRELTFQEDVSDFDFLDDVIFLLSIMVDERAGRIGLFGKGVSLKMTYGDMKNITRSSIVQSCDTAQEIYESAKSLLNGVERRPVRLIGVGVYNLSKENWRQMDFDDYLFDREAISEERFRTRLSGLGKKYGLDFEGNLDKLFSGETLYRTVEYMRKRVR